MSVRVISLSDADDVEDRGSFEDADGTAVRCIDDVIILCETKPDSDPSSPYTIPAGTQATVLLFGHKSKIVQLECYWPEDAFGITYALTSDLRLHLRYEEKVPA